MPNYSQYSPWTDAANYGRGLGDSLSQGLLQLPQERLRLLMQQKQMENQQAQLQAMNNFRMQGLDMRGNQNNTIDAIKMLIAQNQGKYQDSRIDQGQQRIDQTKGELMQYGNGAVGPRFPQQQTQQDQGLPVSDPYAPSNFGQQVQQNPLSLGGGQPQQMPAPQPQGLTQQQPPQNGLPPGVFQVPKQGMPMTANQIDGNTLKALMTMGQAASSTNRSPAMDYIQNNASNIVQRLQGMTQQGGPGVTQMQQPPQQGLQAMPPSQQGGMDTNAILQQAQQAIQQGADPIKVRQRLQSMGLSQ